MLSHSLVIMQTMPYSHSYSNLMLHAHGKVLWELSTVIEILKPGNKAIHVHVQFKSYSTSSIIILYYMISLLRYLVAIYNY